MIKKHHPWLIFIPAIILSAGILIYLLIQYKPLLPNVSEYEKAENNKIFHITTYPDDPTFGNSEATNTIILFEDYNCTECKNHLVFFQNLLKQYPDQIKVIWKNVLLNKQDQEKMLIHKYAYCASQQQAFWPFQMFAYKNENNLSTSTLNAIINNLDEINTKKFEKCLNSSDAADYIEKNQVVAQLLNTKILPTIFLNNKQIHSTDMLIEELNNIFDNKE